MEPEGIRRAPAIAGRNTNGAVEDDVLMDNGDESMNGLLKEHDWKYMRSIHDELLHGLCTRINARASAMASGKDGNPHERYLALYRYIHKADGIIADCFNDWRRSTLNMKILALRRNGLLTDEHVKGLSSEGQEWLRMLEGTEKRFSNVHVKGTRR